MPVTVISLTDPVSTLVTKTNTVSADVGDKSTLVTTDKTDLVSAINEVNGKILSIDTTNQVAQAVETFFSGSNRFDIGGLTIDSGIVNHILKFNDDARLVFGSDSDMHIYHNAGGDTVIQQLDDTKFLNIRAEKLNITGGTDVSSLDIVSGSVTLKHFGTSKLFTENLGTTFTQRARFASGGAGGFSIDGQAGDDNMIALKPLQIKNSSGTVVYAGYLVSGSTDSATL